jgi:hypothetical protein
MQHPDLAQLGRSVGSVRGGGPSLSAIQDNGKWGYRCTYYCTADAECANLQGWELDCAGFCGT